MKTAFLCICMIPFFIGNNLSYAQEVRAAETSYSNIANDTLLPLFEALKEGDVETIRQCISGDMYDRYKTLLEQNKNYPKFLRKFYLGAKFRIERVIAIDGDVNVDVTIDLPNSGTHLTKLCIRKATSSAPWKVVKKIKK